MSIRVSTIWIWISVYVAFSIGLYYFGFPQHTFDQMINSVVTSYMIAFGLTFMALLDKVAGEK